MPQNPTSAWCARTLKYPGIANSRNILLTPTALEQQDTTPRGLNLCLTAPSVRAGLQKEGSRALFKAFPSGFAVPPPAVTSLWMGMTLDLLPGPRY